MRLLSCRRLPEENLQAVETARQLRSRVAQLSKSFSEVENAVGAFPFAEIHSRGERLTRSEVCTSSSLRSLRPCWTVCLNRLRATFWVAVDRAS